MKVLIVGLGSIAKKHINALKQIDRNVEVVALRQTKKKHRDEEEIKAVYHIEELADLHFDFAIISNPTILHKDTIDSLIHLTIPLFIEKPLHVDLSVSELIPMIKNESIQTYVACNLRFYDCIKYMKKYIDNHQPRINEVNVYCGSFLPEWRPGIDFRQNYSSQKSLGGGVHLDLIHELDYLYWLFGNPIQVDKTFKSLSSLKIDAVDYANYILHYPEFCANVILNYFRRDYKRTFEIIFDAETWLVDLKLNKISKNGEVLFESDQTFIDTYKDQLDYFTANLNNFHIMNSIEESYEVLKICL